MNLGEFDFINCVGVLHHLPDPEVGLAALLPSLASDGAMAVLLYGKIGRIGVYHAQEILRRLPLAASFAERVHQARRLLAKLPRTNWLARSAELHPDLHQGGDAALGIADGVEQEYLPLIAGLVRRSERRGRP